MNTTDPKRINQFTFANFFRKDRVSTTGFTIIEMLIVIAIIGLLSAVVLVALGPSRSKAKDTRIISDLLQIRMIGETFYDPSTGMYDMNSLYGAPGVITALTDIGANGGGNAAGKTLPSVNPSSFFGYNPSGPTNYAIIAKMNTGYYCVDTFGNAVQKTTNSFPNIGSGSCK